MFYDLNIHENFTEFKEVSNSGFQGCCISFLRNENPKSITLPTLPKSDFCRIYSRIDLNYNTSIDQGVMSRLRMFDVVCISNVDSSNISSIIKLGPDLIRLKPEGLKHIKKSFINTLKEKQIYLELILREALYGSKDRIIWMNTLRRLLKLGCAKNLIISSGAKVFTEVKRPDDIYKILNLFGFSNDSCKKILHNSEDVLRRAALKRFSSNGAIANTVEEGDLKRDFIINYHKD